MLILERMWNRANLITAFLIPALLSVACSKPDQSSGLASSVLEDLKQLSSTEGFKYYEGNPVFVTGPEGSFDAGALGSMTVLVVDGVFHMYFETWGLRSDAEWDAEEYETLTIGHATSKDGLTWIKDPENPVLDRGGEADFDRTGVWDPYVIYQDGLYKMWYGGGGGSQPNFGWAYATSTDGTYFEKQGLIGIGNPTGVEDCHVVFDNATGLYYMYYWYGWDEPEGLYLVTSPTETGFNFNEKIAIRIEGDDSYMKKFGHVLRDDDGWHMFYSNFVQPHCPNSITRYAFSPDGIHWESKNRRLVKGHDSEVLKADEDLYLMFYSPQNGFDRAGCDIRLSVYHGTLKELASKAPFFELPAEGSLSGKKFTLKLWDGEKLTFHFKPEGEVILTEGSAGVDPYSFNALYTQEGDQVKISGEGIDLSGTYDGSILSLSENTVGEELY